MRPRTSAFLAAGAFVVVAIAVQGLTRRTTTDASLPVPTSTYLPGPGGASAIAEALPRIGVPVSRWRTNYRLLGKSDTARSAPLLVVLGPTRPLDPEEAALLADRIKLERPVLAAGPGAEAFLACFGWGTTWRGEDSIAVRVPGATPTPRAGWVHWVLVPATPVERAGIDERTLAGKAAPHCRPRIRAVDTLLETLGRRPVLVRIHPQAGAPVLLLSDPALVSNRVLRASDLGPYWLRTLGAAGHGVWFDEYHHGYAAGGDLLAAILAWAARSPWGWTAWQLVLVGLLVLVVTLPRTGPVLPPAGRQRRSSLEHVRALATALRAARGHDVAVGLLIRGLRRRLSRDGSAPRDPHVQWLERSLSRARTPRARAAAARLILLTRPGRSADDVLAAANDVEVVWQELRP